MAKIIVEVMPKPEILDPHGKAITGVLERLGETSIKEVRQGKRFEIEVEGGASDEVVERVRELADEVFANQNIEDVVRVSVEEGEDA